MPQALGMSLVDLASRLKAIRDAMAGFPGAPRTQRQIAQAMGLDPANLNSMLSGRRPFPPASLARLHQVMQLETFAASFDLTLWTEGTDDQAAARIKAARGGDVADAIALRLDAHPFFTFVDETQTALIFSKADPKATKWPAIPQHPAKVGAALKLQVTPPIDGFLKLVCVEGGRAIGLDAYFGLTHERLRRGVRKRFTRALEVGANPPEALFVGLVTPQPLGPEWPTRDEASAHLTPGTFAELLRTTLRTRTGIHVAASRLFAV